MVRQSMYDRIGDRGILSGQIWEGFCPEGILSGGFCPGGLCPDTSYSFLPRSFLNATVKELLKSVNICPCFRKKNNSDTFMARSVYC